MKIFILAGLLACAPIHSQKEMKHIEKNGMTVKWRFENDRIFFEISAPTDGWVAIGFNEKSGLAGTYLLMGNVVNGKANLLENRTLAAGNYQSFKKLGAPENVQNVAGFEKGKFTQVEFSLPVSPSHKFQKNLTENSEYEMLIAFSREDDFQHHSMMRTSVNVKL